MSASLILLRAAERRERGQWVKAIDYSPASEDERERCYRFLSRMVPRGDVGRFIERSSKSQVVAVLRQAADAAAREGD